MAEGFRSTYIEKYTNQLPLLRNFPKTQYAKSRPKEEVKKEKLAKSKSRN